ncbi:ribosomal L7Ae/L30e/S12e/Gadd45 family protein [Caldalkalibacillus salinus]|uniref:ribosomal L7Ae/L30e/S12e/Gadd45 family protein n=1 Tax=Caldalkalibacillus salinus TaxID=2803787 RepID=UPI0019223814
MNPRFYQLLGLAMRAGKLVSGEEPVLNAVRHGRVALICIAGDASSNTLKKTKDKATYYGVDNIIVSSRQELGNAIGKAERVVVGVTDVGFAKQLMKLYDNQ